MDLKQLLIISLRRPVELPNKLSPVKLELNTVVEGALFIAVTTSLLNSSLDRFIFKSSENASKLLENSSFSFIFDPLSMFAFELIFIITVMGSILFFSNFSSQKVSVEELGKNVLFLFLVAFIFKFTQVFFVFISIDLYYIFRFAEVLWFIWALSSVVAMLYQFKSVLLTAFLGTITVSLTMGLLFMIFVSLLQSLLVGNIPNV
tara:strand:+ start:997 stop:1608 length:612 start_codon:yes stop_codon:yes gene_type:complete